MVAAPAIVRVASIMPVKALPSERPITSHDIWAQFHERLLLDLNRPNGFVEAMRKAKKPEMIIVGRDAWGEFQRHVVALA